MAAEGRHSSVTAYTAVRNYNRQLNSFASINTVFFRYFQLDSHINHTMFHIRDEQGEESGVFDEKMRKKITKVVDKKKITE